jgi:hypothetical protein
MNSAQELQRIIPDLYLNRDNGDLVRYFEACGVLLDQMQQTLLQRLADNFPDNPVDGSLACQDWLIPYFARLLDVKLVSPTPRGQRDEVANAISWRQSKGTLRTIEAVAQSVGQLEMVLHEGWRRVAITARIDTPLISAVAYGYDREAPAAYPSLAARHPGLPAATVDFGCPAGAVPAGPANPAVQQSTVDGDTHLWRQASFHGAPCHPGSYDDPSRRTVDFRSGNWRDGHFHPRKVLLYYAPPAGFFSPQMQGTVWPSGADSIDELDWPLASDPFGADFHDLIEVIDEPGRTIFRNRLFGSEAFLPVRISRVVHFGQGPSATPGDPDTHIWRFEGIVFNSRMVVHSGRVEFDECAARRVEILSVDADEPVMDARNSLIKALQATQGLVQLEYCTLLNAVALGSIKASDCLFRGDIRGASGPNPPAAGCVRYSRVTPEQVQIQALHPGLHLKHVSTLDPVMFTESFGERGCGVLHPATPKAIRQGADGGGELGAYHQRRLAMLPEAVLEKLADFLPVGYEAVPIPDERMLALPD